MSRDTAFLYDFLLVRGGAEQTAVQLHRLRPDIDIVVGFVDRRVFPAGEYPAANFRSLTGVSRIRGWQGLKTMSAFRRKAEFLAAYRTVIYSGVYAPVAVHHRAGGRNVLYCHTPPRFVYDLRDHYLQTAPVWQRPLIRALIPYVRREYERSIRAMDLVIANSRNVSQRLAKYLHITDAPVVHPPVATGQFQWRSPGDYYLSTARLEPYKRVETIIRAFMRMRDRQLIVASGGSDAGRLRKLASGHANIRFAGWCDEDRMRQLLGNCIASLYLPRDEDFGMSPVESMAAGKPVIGVAEGGLLETVVPGETGVLIDPGYFASTQAAADAICDAVAKLGPGVAAGMRAACEERAERFSAERFCARLSALAED